MAASTAFPITTNPRLQQHVKARVGFLVGGMRNILRPLGNTPVTAATLHQVHAVFGRLIQPAVPIRLQLKPASAKPGEHFGPTANSASFDPYGRSITLYITPEDHAADRVALHLLHLLGHEWTHVDQALPTHLSTLIPAHEIIHHLAGQVARHASVADLLPIKPPIGYAEPLTVAEQETLQSRLNDTLRETSPDFWALLQDYPVHIVGTRPTPEYVATRLYSAGMVAWGDATSDDALPPDHMRTAFMHREWYAQVVSGAMVAPSYHAESEAYVVAAMLAAPTDDTPIETVRVASWCEITVALPDDMRTPHLASRLGQ